MPFISQKRAAFHSLVMKERPFSTRERPSFTSRPGPASAAMVKRTASAPKLSISSRGSITFPLLFDIFWPFSSRTSPCM